MQSEYCSVGDITKEQQQMLQKQLNEKDDEYQCLFEEEEDHLQPTSNKHFDDKIKQAE